MEQEVKQQQAVPTPVASSEKQEPSSPIEGQNPKRRRGRPTHEEQVAKARRSAQSDFLVGCNLDERAWAVSFIRLIRTNYWLSHFMKNLLRLDANKPNQVPISEVKAQIGYAEDVEEVVRRIQFIGKTGWYRDHPLVASIVDETGDDIYEYQGDKKIRDLIESAKKACGFR